LQTAPVSEDARHILDFQPREFVKILARHCRTMSLEQSCNREVGFGTVIEPGAGAQRWPKSVRRAIAAFVVGLLPGSAQPARFFNYGIEPGRARGAT